ncbi:DUF106 domain-containing protein [Candidatus Woesearchaeota archaeon]|nr:DUF106 domain-containing protein [Candidatus Woesearchaeota archaeon]
MGLFNILDPVLDAVFFPLLKLPPIIGLLILSVLITLIITLVYKYSTDQVLLKSIKEKQKKIQAEIKKNKDNPQKVLKLQREAMQSSSEMMKQSFRSMFYTFIPIIIIFGWVSSHFAYVPIGVGDEFNVTLIMKKNSVGNVEVTVPEGLELVSDNNLGVSQKQMDLTFRATGAGVHEIVFVKGNQFLTKDIVVDGESKYIKNVKASKSIIDYIYGSREGFLESGDIFQIKVNYEKLKPLAFTNIPWVKNRGWLFTYIIFSIFLSINLRKWMKVH